MEHWEKYHSWLVRIYRNRWKFAETARSRCSHVRNPIEMCSNLSEPTKVTLDLLNPTKAASDSANLISPRSVALFIEIVRNVSDSIGHLNLAKFQRNYDNPVVFEKEILEIFLFLCYIRCYIYTYLSTYIRAENTFPPSIRLSFSTYNLRPNL